MCAFIDISVPAEIIEYPSLHFQDILGGGGGGGGGGRGRGPNGPDIAHLANLPLFGQKPFSGFPI